MKWFRRRTPDQRVGPPLTLNFDDEPRVSREWADVTYPPYNPDGRCPKCHSAALVNKHHPEQTFRPVAFSWESLWLYDPPRPERIERQCRNCGYVWDEAPLNTTGSEDTP